MAIFPARAAQPDDEISASDFYKAHPIVWSTHRIGISLRAKSLLLLTQLPFPSKMSSEATEPQPPAKPPPVRYHPAPRIQSGPPPSKKEFIIGGFKVFVYGLDKVKPEIPRMMLILLHGRGGDHTQFEEFIEFMDLKSINRSRTRRQLYAPGGDIVLI